MKVSWTISGTAEVEHDDCLRDPMKQGQLLVAGLVRAIRDAGGGTISEIAVRVR